jgi:hypothetical protein
MLHSIDMLKKAQSPEERMPVQTQTATKTGTTKDIAAEDTARRTYDEVVSD